jgi:hypothetical protein
VCCCFHERVVHEARRNPPSDGRQRANVVTVDGARRIDGRGPQHLSRRQAAASAIIPHLEMFEQ